MFHAIHRAQSSSIRKRREDFVKDLVADIEVVPFTKDTAIIAGRLDGEQRSQEVSIPFGDLLIGVTALEHRYSIAALNLRHFRLIPGLQVITI